MKTLGLWQMNLPIWVHASWTWAPRSLLPTKCAKLWSTSHPRLSHQVKVKRSMTKCYSSWNSLSRWIKELNCQMTSSKSSTNLKLVSMPHISGRPHWMSTLSSLNRLRLLSLRVRPPGPRPVEGITLQLSSRIKVKAQVPTSRKKPSQTITRTAAIKILRIACVSWLDRHSSHNWENPGSTSNPITMKLTKLNTCPNIL